MKNMIIKIIVLGMAALQVGCSDVKLSPYEAVNYASSATSLSFCTTDSATINSNLKFIIVMDKSTSNQETYDLVTQITGPGTDPTGARRYSALVDFIQNYSGDPQYTYWSLVNFASDSDTVRGFTTNRSSFATLLDNEWIGNGTAQPLDQRQPDDGGFTNYMSAMDRLTTLIEDDIEANRNSNPLISSTYIIFYISDGAPYVAQGSQLVLQDADDILARVESLAALERTERTLVDSIQFNTAYYYSQNPDQAALDLLRQMSSVGGGTSYEFAAGQTIDYTRFAVPERVARYALKEVWIANANTVWNGNRLVADNDADGLSNSQEFSIGSDPDQYDSDGNGVGDGVEYKYWSGSRTVTGGFPFAQCGSADRISSSPLVFADTDKDFLNDCEERLIGTDYQNPDSNFDYVPDWFGFVSNIQIIGGSDLMIDGVDGDGVTNYYELKNNTPVNIHNSQVPGIEYLRYSGRMTQSTATQDCHDYSISNLPFHGPNDRIRVMIFENTRSIDEKVIFRVAEERINAYGTVYITEANLR